MRLVSPDNAPPPLPKNRNKGYHKNVLVHRVFTKEELAVRNPSPGDAHTAAHSRRPPL